MWIWITIYIIGFFVCCALMNKKWYDEFGEYNVYWAALGSFIWFIFAIGWLLGILGKLLFIAFERVLREVKQW